MRVARAMVQRYCDDHSLLRYRLFQYLVYAPVTDEPVEYYFGAHLVLKEYAVASGNNFTDINVELIRISVGYNVAVLARLVKDPPRIRHNLKVNIEKQARRYARSGRRDMLYPEDINVLRGKIYCYTIILRLSYNVHCLRPRRAWARKCLERACHHLVQILNGTVCQAQAGSVQIASQ